MSLSQQTQSRQDREYILANLPLGTKRVQVVNSQGKTQYKRPEDVDIIHDRIPLSADGAPVVMRGKPGRKRKVDLKPISPQVAELEGAREDLIETSELMQEIKKNPGSDAALDSIVVALGEEATAIEFERLEAQRHGRGEDVATLATKRSRVLKALSDTVLKRKSLEQGGVVDLEGAPFQAVFEYTLETFKDAMKEAGCRPEQIEQTFTALVSSLDDSWKAEARARMKEKTR